jgi:hypothetical protein
MALSVTDNVLHVFLITEYSSGEYLRHAMMSKEAKMELMSRILGQHSQNTDAVRVLSGTVIVDWCAYHYVAGDSSAGPTLRTRC